MQTIRDAIKDLPIQKLREITELDVDNPDIKKFIEIVHSGTNRRLKSLPNMADVDYVYESRLFQILCKEKFLSVNRCVEKLRTKYGYDVTANEVIRVFRFHNITDFDSREELFIWASAAADAFVKALVSKDSEDFEAYMKMKGNPDYRKVKSRIFCLMLYTKYPELDIHGDLENFAKFGNVYAQYLRYDMNDFLKEICGAQGKNKNQSAAQSKIEQLENTLKRNEMMLKDLQDDFESRLEEIHQNEMTDFFSRLNSEKYGCILDAIINVRDGVRKLRKQNVNLPPEISGLFILVDNLTKFVRDHEINPIMKLGSVHSMKFNEIESCDYEGSPYVDAEEIKQVKVLSPGWFYKNKDIQIARPRLKEIEEDAAE